MVVAHQEVGEMIDYGDSFGCPHFFLCKKITPKLGDYFSFWYFILSHSIPDLNTLYRSLARDA